MVAMALDTRVLTKTNGDDNVVLQAAIKCAQDAAQEVTDLYKRGELYGWVNELVRLHGVNVWHNEDTDERYVELTVTDGNRYDAPRVTINTRTLELAYESLGDYIYVLLNADACAYIEDMFTN
jgi:hypothetical protein